MRIRKAALIYLKEQKLLVTKSKGKELYYIPGGKLEPEESEKDALIREIKEELSVDITPETVQYYATFEAPADGKANNVVVEIIGFMAEFTGEIIAANEIAEFDWLSFADIEKVSAVNQLIFRDLKAKGLLL